MAASTTDYDSPWKVHIYPNRLNRPPSSQIYYCYIYLFLR